jgi:hypothetical protein
MTWDELSDLNKKVQSALENYENGIPLKDVWDERDDTILLMKAFEEVYWALWSQTNI